MDKEIFIEKPHTKSTENIIDQYQTDINKGLDDAEAKNRQKIYGLNQLEEKEQKSIFDIIIDQVNTPVVYLLFAAAVLSLVFGDIPEAIAIFAVLLINAGIGFWMEFQARQSMQALKQMDKIQAKVIRNGEEKNTDAEYIVPGDIIVLEAGDLISADGRLIETSETEINESALTGESVPVEKNTTTLEENTETADRNNMAFKGTAMTRGKAKMVVTATGMHTQLGNISEMVSSAEEEEIPLNEKLHTLTKKLIWVVLGMAALLGLVGLVIQKDFYTIVQTSIAWAIAAIPEGLPIVASIALARGMLRLARHNVIVKRLASVEALGETNIIFTDKTGTLTENRLTVSQLALPDNKSKVQWDQDNQMLHFEDEKIEESDNFKELLKIAVLCNDADFDTENEDKSEGDPLEIALLKYAHYYDADKKEDYLKMERIGEDPFDSESKMMGTIYKTNDEYYVTAKGASNPILENSSRILKDGEVKELTDDEKKNWLQLNDEMANEGLRTLAFAYRISREKPIEHHEDEFIFDLIFVGLIGFIDPPRQEVKEAIDTCQHAGIEVVMVTGDHPGTAENIARQVGLVDQNKEINVIHGSDLSENNKSDEEITKARIFARVNPEQKYDIVEKFKKTGKIIGMTGDGVNDAPALKKADIGISMGKRGTQVAKEVSDMVLKDDAFPSIVKAIRQGRIIFGNIRKFIIYQLSYHFGEILVIAAISFSLFKLPLLPLQLLFLNILLDVFPALALGIGEGRENIMDDPPKDPEEPILHKKSWKAILVFGSIFAAIITGAYFYGYYVWDLSHEICNNIAFFSLGFSQILHTLDMRDSEENIFNNQVTRNKYVWGAIIFSLIVLIGIYFIPFFQNLLRLQPMEQKVWILIAIASLLPMGIIQFVKQMIRV